MSISSIKKVLLAGTALVAVAIISTQAYADPTVVLDGVLADDTWAGTGGAPNVPDGKAANALAGDNVSLATHTLTITNNQVANDGSVNKDTFAIGTIDNNVIGAGGVAITQSALGTVNPFVVNIGAITSSAAGGSTLAITNNDTAAQAVNVTDGGVLTLSGALSVINSDTAATSAISLTVTGVTTVGGTTTLTGGAAAGDTVSVVNTGLATYTGAVTVTGGTGANASASITLNGTGTNAFTNGLTLADGTTPGSASLTVSGGGAQTVSGVINGGTGGDKGTLTTNNAALVTFSNAVGGTSLHAINLNGAGGTTFSGTTGATTISVGNAGGTDTFSGLVTATNLTYGAAGTVALNGAGTNAIGTIGFAANAGNLNFGDGANLTGAVTTTGGVGTVTMAGATAITGTLGAAGGGHALALVNAGAGAVSVSGLVFATALDFNGANTVTLNGAGDNTIATVALAASGGTLALGDTANVTGAITTTANTSTLTLLGSSTIGGQVGATGAPTSLLAINAGATGKTANFTGSVFATTTNAGPGTIAFGSGNNTTNVSFGGNDGTVTLAGGGAFTGNVDNSVTANKGTLTLLGATAVSGTVGVTDALKVVNAGLGASSFGGIVNTQTLNVTGANTVSLNGTAVTNMIGTLAFGASGGTISLADTGNLTGNITTTANTSTLTLAGASTITGNVGATGVGLNLLAVNAGTGADIITGNVFATTITATGSAGIEFGGNVTATTLALAATTGTVQIDSGKSLSAAVTGAGASTLTFAGGAQSDTGAINDTALIINAGALAADTVTFNSDITNAATLAVGNGHVALKGNTTGALLFNALSTGTVTVDAGKNFTGDMSGTGGVAGAGIGNVILSGTSTLGTIGANGVLKSMTLNNPVVGTQVTVSSGNVTAADTTALGINVLSATGTFTAGNNQTITATINGLGTDPTSYGHITSTAAATTTTGVTGTALHLTISPAITFPVGTQSYNIIAGTGGAGVLALGASKLTINGVADTVGGATPLVEGVMTYVQTGIAGPDLTISATRANTATIGSTANNVAVATALDTIGATGDAALNAIQGSIAAAPSAAAVNAILSSLLPTVDGGAQMSAQEVIAEVEDIANSRMAALRADDGSTGVAAGATANGVSMWAQGYGQTGTQDERSTIAGYKADTWGGTVGFDSENLLNNGILGFALNYGKADVKSANLNTTKTNIDDYGFMLYGTVGLEDQMFINSQAGFGYNKITSIRHNVGGAGGPDADGSTHSDQYDAKLTFGRDYGVDYGTILTPLATAAYTHLNTKAYTETGTGANLTVNANSQNNLDFGIGGKIAWKLKNPDGSVMKPVLHAGYTYAAVDDRIETDSSFAGGPAVGNPTFVTTGAAPERNRFDVGAGITYMTTANWDLSAVYNYAYRTDYKAHTGTMRATAHF